MKKTDLNKTLRGTSKVPRTKFASKTVNILNVTLVLISAILILNLFNIQIPNIGFTIQNAIDPEDPACFASYQDSAEQINLNYCCHEAKKQLECINNKQTINNIESDITCQTGTNSNTIKFHLTNAANRYCQQNY